MEIRLEILKAYVLETIASNFEKMNINADKIVETRAIQMLSEILIAIRDDSLTDFDVVEEIVSVFEKNDITCLGRHDF